MHDLPLHTQEIDVGFTGSELTKIFNHNPLLPGVILVDAGKFIGMVSRRRFLELMSRPYALDLFTKRAISRLYPFTQADLLILSGCTSIVTATQQALQRNADFLYEPIVVQLHDRHYLLDFHQLLVANSHIHELTTTLLNQQTEAKFIQTEKMASLGQMIAGVAHEILNPVNFIWGNIDYLSHYSHDLIQVISAYEAALPHPPQEIKTLKTDVEFDFIAADLERVISSIKMGAERLQKIIGALRNFSHMDEVNKRPIDLHECLENTLLILNNRLKHSITVIRNYGELPPINCYSGQLSQVFMNVISNAIDALTEQALTADHPPQAAQIEITTRVYAENTPTRTQRWVTVAITDNGPGIPISLQDQIFNMFFTTKPAGKGTGLGLAISHQIVTEKHGGRLTVQSAAGAGTTFEILLPLEEVAIAV